MKGVYEQNPALGDPMSIEGQLNESSHKLEKFRAELRKFQTYLDEAVASPVAPTQHHSPSAPQRRAKQQPTPVHNQLNGLARHHRHSGGSAGEEDSLSRSASDSSVSNPASAGQKQSAPGTPLPSHG